MRARKKNLQPAADAEVVADAAAGTVAEAGAKTADAASTAATDATFPPAAFSAASNRSSNKPEPNLRGDNFKSPT
jgi:hypothetical protein